MRTEVRWAGTAGGSKREGSDRTSDGFRHGCAQCKAIFIAINRFARNPMNTNCRLRTLISLALATALAGCSENPDATGPDGASDLYITATVDGSAWSATPSTIVSGATGTTHPGSLTFQGSSMAAGNTRTLSFVLTRIPGIGTYPLGVNIGTTTGGIVTMSLQAQAWTTPLSGRAGTVTVEAITDSRVRGTFSFQSEAVGNSTPAMVTVTNGRFSVARSNDFVAATPDQLGSRVSATVGGQSWNAATVVVSIPAPGQLTLAASNTDYMMTMLVGPVSGPGSGPLGPGVPVRRLSFQRIPAGGFWGGTAADQGTITITSWTATRITGSFSGSLAAAAGGSSSALSVSGGTFDLRIP
jgi:hypothetical protein